MTTTPTTASVYQQLRGHLTELKLADAAEALPGILDHAQAEDWTLTHALERLLAIKVTATEKRRLAGRFRFANLPTGGTAMNAAAASPQTAVAPLNTSLRSMSTAKTSKVTRLKR